MIESGEFASVVYFFNDTYNTLEDVLLFTDEESARDYLRYLKGIAEKNGVLEDYRNDQALAFLTVINMDNHVYTYSLDLVPKSVI